MTLEESFDKEFPWIHNATQEEFAIKNWFKAYILNLLEEVRVGKETLDHLDFRFRNGYNQALSNQSSKINQVLKERGIL